MTLDAQRLHSLLAAIPHGIQENDLNGVITYSNLAHHEMLGYKPGELVGMTIYDLIYSPNERNELKNYIAYLIAEQPTPTPYISKSRRKDGSPLATQVDWAYQYNEKNILIGFVSIISDITNQETAEKEKYFLSDQIRQSQKMEALGQLTGGIAHDFNNILASILGYADLTLDAVSGMGEKSLVRYQREVINAAEKARDLIAQMLAFARAKPSDPIMIMPIPLLKESIRMLQSALPSSIELSICGDEELSSIIIDPAQFHQAIVNLCINARDAIKDTGNINISVMQGHYDNHHCDACHQSFSGEYVEISVSDSGAGIDPAITHKIFEPYFSAKNNTQNTGTGLSAVNSIIHDHNGHISVESYKNAGTNIKLYFPAIKAQPEIEDDTDKNRHIKYDSVPYATLLIVDDEESIASLQGEVLKNAGLTVLVFSDAIQALNTFKISPNQFDLILTDQTMPSLTGIDLAKTALAIRADIPIILSTAQGDNDYQQVAAEAGIQGYLTKPVPSTELINTVRDLLIKNKK